MLISVTRSGIKVTKLQKQVEHEMVTLLTNAKGELYTCSQMQDYVFRGKQMEHCCLLAFVTDTWEETYQCDNNKQ